MALVTNIRYVTRGGEAEREQEKVCVEDEKHCQRCEDRAAAGGDLDHGDDGEEKDHDHDGDEEEEDHKWTM